jgi:hypothetical protein
VHHRAEGALEDEAAGAGAVVGVEGAHGEGAGAAGDVGGRVQLERVEGGARGEQRRELEAHQLAREVGAPDVAAVDGDVDGVVLVRVRQELRLGARLAVEAIDGERQAGQDGAHAAGLDLLGRHSKL